MNILHVVPTYLPAYRYGGTIFSVHRLCRGLIAQGCDLEVFTSNVNGLETLNVPVGVKQFIEDVPVTYFDVVGIPRLYCMPKMLELLSNDRFDIVHIHSVFNLATTLTMRACLSRSIPYVLAPRGMLESGLISAKNSLLKKLWIGVLDRNLYRNAVFHFTSNREKAMYQELGLPMKKEHVIPNGIEVDKIPTEIGVKDPYLLYLGRVNWKKNIDIAIKSLPYIASLNLKIVGPEDPDEKSRLVDITKLNRLENRVEFLGAQYGKDKDIILAKAFCLILISKSENFGNVILEALSAGTPVIVSKGVGLADELLEYNAGLVVDPVVESVADAVNKLSDKRLYESLVMNGRKLLKARYAIDVVSRSTIEMYQDTVCRLSV